MRALSYDTENIRRRIDYLPQGLLEHIERVVEIALQLAQRFHVDSEKVEVAVLLHDIARIIKGDKLLSLARAFGLPVTPLDKRLPVFLHGPVGAEIVRRDFQIQDEEILAAIRSHTIGQAGMGPVARVVYLADKIEPSKDSRYPFNSRVRELAKKGLDEAILKFISCEVSAHIARGEYIHPRTIDARNDLLVKLKSASS